MVRQVQSLRNSAAHMKPSPGDQIGGLSLSSGGNIRAVFSDLETSEPLLCHVPERAGSGDHLSELAEVALDACVQVGGESKKPPPDDTINLFPFPLGGVACVFLLSSCYRLFLRVSHGPDFR